MINFLIEYHFWIGIYLLVISIPIIKITKDVVTEYEKSNKPLNGVFIAITTIIFYLFFPIVLIRLVKLFFIPKIKK